MAVELSVKFTPHAYVNFKYRLEQILVVQVAIAAYLPTESIYYSAGVGVHYEAWSFRCVKDDVIGGFFTDSVDIEQSGS